MEICSSCGIEYDFNLYLHLVFLYSVLPILCLSGYLAFIVWSLVNIHIILHWVKLLSSRFRSLIFYALNLWRYLRDFEVETIGLKETSRRCSNVDCGAKLRDTVLDWEVLVSCFSWLHYSCGSGSSSWGWKTFFFNYCILSFLFLSQVGKAINDLTQSN